MKLVTDNETIIYIDDESEEAKKISLGYSWEWVNGKVVVAPNEEAQKKEEFIEKLKNNTATQKDKDEMLIHLLSKDMIK